MLDNNTYNLFAQITEESQSLWRIRNSYIADAEPCQECMEFWERLAQDKEQHIQDLEKLIMEHTEACTGVASGAAATATATS
jgi:hypothetical protein